MQNGGVAYADNTVCKRLLASFTLDGDDEADQMIAVSRQRRQTHTTHKRQNAQSDGEAEPDKYQFTTAGHRRAAESTLERTHSRTHTKLAANVHTLAPTQSDNLAAALHYSTTTIV